MTDDVHPIGIFGDWHGEVGFGIDAIRSAAADGVRTMIHVGDFPLDWPGALRGRFEQRLNKQLVEHDIRLIVSPGNHDNWDTILKLPVGDSGLITWRSNIFVLPRGGRTVVEGLVFGGLGGAYSVDQQWRTEGKSWWAEEEPTTEEAEKLIADGAVDVLITHDAPAGVPLQSGFELTPEVEKRANQTRVLLRDVVDQLQPGLVFCGHWHQRRIHDVHHPSEQTTTVHVLADEDSRAGNAVLLWPGETPFRVEPMIARGS
ncbi:metallophosphoesterase [Pseudarthrobacter sp. PH31-O2]|uniref:metallophosphoesterase family protein n=1 Tax=Pseudarthrobacter sp. PH31-O2 TaxID=3046206 RepID=UPI0024BAFCAE|nr:metallophosphoesterase [Pseudarthrobacter sp. PH31-O2]MDJ0354408.1 metallophosphoesterase [Pseudarthrobacter sp. PH31-O2]